MSYKNNKACSTAAAVALLLWHAVFSPVANAEMLIGEGPALGPPETRPVQTDLQNGTRSLIQIRQMGLRIFTTRFRHADGYGDGPIEFGGRPTLQNNGTFLRVNGLDAQTCVACHDVISTDAAPPVLGVGGAAGIGNSAMFMTRAIDVADVSGNGFAGFDGRLINPPALFGVGGVQLVGKEMTEDLQQLKNRAIGNPNMRVKLQTKGVQFGHIVADEAGNLDTTGIEGIDPDLVVRPFGRKGEFTTVRQFDVGALMFHFGMQPVELVGRDIDADGDGVANEITIGELSALEVFLTTQERPVQLPLDQAAQRGYRYFQRTGCADCHRPSLATRGRNLTYSYPEIETDPSLNVFLTVDLTELPAAFESTQRGGLVVSMFSDLKRHDMGPALAEDFHAATAKQNREFVTAKLWGVADSAPYLHDGRALTLNEAILLHGGEAQGARDAYAALSVSRKNELITFLSTLRNPRNPNADVLQ